KSASAKSPSTRSTTSESAAAAGASASPDWLVPLDARRYGETLIHILRAPGDAAQTRPGETP
ncbi:MAG: hypothetical protein AAFR84_08825, partial [Pseudomonadota bacterium]